MSFELDGGNETHASETNERKQSNYHNPWAMLGRNEHDAAAQQKATEDSGHQINKAADYGDELVSGAYELSQIKPTIKVKVDNTP